MLTSFAPAASAMRSPSPVAYFEVIRNAFASAGL